MTNELTASVVNLVSSAWEDLSPVNVTVVTTDGQMPATGHGHNPMSVAGDQELETTLAERVVQTLTPVVGSEHVKSSVTIDYEQNSGESTQELYDPANTVVLTSQTSTETVADLAPAGIPGTPSNTPAAASTTSVAATQAKTASTTQGIQSESKTFAVSHTTHHVLEPAGKIRRIAAAILVDDVVETKTESGKTQQTRRKRTAEEMKQIDALAKAAVGFDAQRGDQFSLQNVAFVVPPAEIFTPPGKFQKWITYAERWTGLLRYAGLFVLFAMVYVLILRPVKRQVLNILRLPATNAVAEHNAALAHGGAGMLPGTGGALPEVSEAVALKRELASRVKEDPETAGRVVQSWMQERRS